MDVAVELGNGLGTCPDSAGRPTLMQYYKFVRRTLPNTTEMYINPMHSEFMIVKIRLMP